MPTWDRKIMVLVSVREHPILQTIQGRMNVCQHRVPVSIERKGNQDQPRETLQNRVVQQSKRGLGHIITEEGCQKSRILTQRDPPRKTTTGLRHQSGSQQERYDGVG
jgi:hypothetical protein